MNYIGSIYRPPSEANSLILQVTVGCSHNKCTFCNMYKDKKFFIKKDEDIFEELETASYLKDRIDRIFLADGNALMLPTDRLVKIMRKTKEVFPLLKRVAVYGAASDILRKTPEELKFLRDEGLGIIYLGAESGSYKILKMIKKDAGPEQMIEASKKAIGAGILLSVMLISGIGGPEYTEIHALESARLASEISPDYLSLLTLRIYPGTELFDQTQSGIFVPMPVAEILIEARQMIENIDAHRPIVFRSNHASNHLLLKGTLPQDKDRLIKQIDMALAGEIELNRYRGL